MNSFDALDTLEGRRIIDLPRAARALPEATRLPICRRILLENLLRREDAGETDAALIRRFAAAAPEEAVEIAFQPTRIILQDYSGLPALLDLAAFRDAVAEAGGAPESVDPLCRVDLVIDHSLRAAAARRADALRRNESLEIAENRERFQFLKWAQSAFRTLRVVPPGQGIIHQIHVERLADIVAAAEIAQEAWLHPDSVIGADSHTTMVNGLGVLGWGVGGVEAEAAMLGEPISLLSPPVIGVRLTGAPAPTTLATDLALTLTERLRARGVVGAFLEFFGPGAAALPAPDRLTIANMAPEFGATIAFFPTDAATFDYLAATGRPAAEIARTRAYLARNRLLADPDLEPAFADVVEFDLGAVRRVVSGPRRPQERRDLAETPAAARAAIGRPPRRAGRIGDGDVALAAITSCTNTSNPTAMIAAGLLARKARALGLRPPERVKTSLAPGSRVVADYLRASGLLDDLEALGFHLVGFGCTTCVGNSGDLDPEIEAEIDREGLVVASVLSGNRNFEARIHPKIRANFLASPPLVAAYALAGTTLIDLDADPIGQGPDGAPVRLADLWPSAAEIAALGRDAVTPERFDAAYARIFEGSEAWAALPTAEGPRLRWEAGGAYLRRPPFFDLAPPFQADRPILDGARILLRLGDDVTTDHISPVGRIAPDSEAGRFLAAAGTAPADFNTYGARRGDHEVMTRGTFANLRLRNRLVDGVGPTTRLFPDGAETSVYAAARAYAERGEPAAVIAGRNYGAGSARDWAAKGTRLLGVRAVLAESFERIHRTNLIGFGVLPLAFAEPGGAEAAGLSGAERLFIDAPFAALTPRSRLTVRAVAPDGTERAFEAVARVDTERERAYLAAGGILTYVRAARLDRSAPPRA